MTATQRFFQPLPAHPAHPDTGHRGRHNPTTNRTAGGLALARIAAQPSRAIDADLLATSNGIGRPHPGLDIDRGTRNCSSPAHHAPLALSGSAEQRASVPGERDDSIEGSPAAPGDGGVLIDSVNDTASAARSNRGSGRTLPLGATKPGGYDRHHGLTAAVLVAMNKSTSEQGGKPSAGWRPIRGCGSIR